MRFILLLVASFVFFSLTSFSIIGSGKLRNTQAAPLVSGESKSEEMVLAPVFIGVDTNPELSAISAYAMDLNTDIPLYEKNQDLPHSPASTTKIITALVAIDNYPLGKVIKVGDINVDGQKMKLVAGEEISVRNLLYGLLIFSANDAAEVLAQNYKGGREAFIEAMNVKAQKLGLNHSFFTNPSGLDGEVHVTSSRDLVKVSVIAMKNPFFREVVGTKDIVVTSVDGTYQHKLVNLNELVGKVDGVMGVKTGWTETAQENLVTYVERGEKRVMIAVLGSQDRFGDTEKLIDWIFANHDWQMVYVDDLPNYSEVSISAP